MLSKLQEMEQALHESFSHDIVDPVERKKSRFYVRWLDHEVLRVNWHNFAQIAPGVYRSNHPTRERFEAYAAMGISTILNLRGRSHHAYYRFEVETCRDLGLKLVDVKMSARSAPSRKTLLKLVKTFETIEEPYLIHCKSGADRTGLAAAIYALAIEGRSIEEAKKALSLRFLHIKSSKTGVLDYVLHLYEKRQLDGPIGFVDWLEREYDKDEVTKGFARLSIFGRLGL